VPLAGSMTLALFWQTVAALKAASCSPDHMRLAGMESAPEPVFERAGNLRARNIRRSSTHRTRGVALKVEAMVCLHFAGLAAADLRWRVAHQDVVAAAEAVADYCLGSLSVLAGRMAGLELAMAIGHTHTLIHHTHCRHTSFLWTPWVAEVVAHSIVAVVAFGCWAR
jgi:hypothetical protein